MLVSPLQIYLPLRPCMWKCLPQSKSAGSVIYPSGQSEQEKEWKWDMSCQPTARLNVPCMKHSSWRSEFFLSVAFFQNKIWNFTFCQNHVWNSPALTRLTLTPSILQKCCLKKELHRIHKGFGIQCMAPPQISLKPKVCVPHLSKFLRGDLVAEVWKLCRK